MPYIFGILFAASAALMIFLLVKKVPEAKNIAVLKSALVHNMPIKDTMNAAASQAGNVILRVIEKTLRKAKVYVLKFDNWATHFISRSRERSKRMHLNYSDWRMRKHGFPKISFESSFVTNIEEWFEGFFSRYFRKGVGYERTTIRDDLETREKVLVSAILTNPKDVDAYKQLGLFYFEKGNMFDSLAAFEAIRKIDPTNSEAAERVRHIREVTGYHEAGANSENEEQK